MNEIYRRKNYKIKHKNHTIFPKYLIYKLSNNNNNKNIDKDYIKSSLNNLNDNNKKKLNKSRSFQTKKIMEDFKATIKQTQALKNKIINSNLAFNKKNKLYNNNPQNKNNLNINFNDNISIIHKDQDSNISNIIDNSINFDFNENNKSNNNNFYGNKNIYKSSSNIFFNRKNKEKENIESMNCTIKNLGNANNKIINQNNFLEKEIEKFISLQKNNNHYDYDKQKPANYYDINLKNFINGLKLSLRKNIIENLQLAKNITNLLKIMNSIYNNYSVNNNTYNTLYNKIIKYDKNNSIKKIDGKKLDKLNEEQIKLNKELNRLKMNLKDLKTREKILSIKYESNLKSKQDYEEIVLKLNNNIKKLNNENLSISRASSYTTIYFNNKNNNSFDIYEIKKNQLENIIKSIQNQKHILIEENYKIKKENMDLNNINKKGKEKSHENISIKQLNEIKNENIKKKKELEKKEKEIIALKQIIDKINSAIKENNTDKRIFQFDIDNLIEDDSEDIDFKNLLKKNKLEENIIIANYMNLQKLKEINNTTKQYEECIKEKDQIINDLENKIDNKKIGLIKTLEEKVKPLYKKSIIPRENSFTFTNKNNLKISNNKFLKLNKSIS